MATSAQRDERQEEDAAAGAHGQRAKRTRLTIDVSPELRRRIKIAAAQQDISTRHYIEHLLEAAVPEVPAEQAGETARRRPVTEATRQWVLAARERINQGQTFSDSVEIIHQMREERTEHLMRVVDSQSDERQDEGQDEGATDE